jgi:hypothetical protein
MSTERGKIRIDEPSIEDVLDRLTNATDEQLFELYLWYFPTELRKIRGNYPTRIGMIRKLIPILVRERLEDPYISLLHRQTNIPEWIDVVQQALEKNPDQRERLEYAWRSTLPTVGQQDALQHPKEFSTIVTDPSAYESPTKHIEAIKRHVLDCDSIYEELDRYRATCLQDSHLAPLSRIEFSIAISGEREGTYWGVTSPVVSGVVWACPCLMIEFSLGYVIGLSVVVRFVDPTEFRMQDIVDSIVEFYRSPYTHSEIETITSIPEINERFAFAKWHFDVDPNIRWFDVLAHLDRLPRSQLLIGNTVTANMRGNVLQVYSERESMLNELAIPLIDEYPT